MNVSVPVMKPVIVLNKIFPMPLSVTMGVGNKEVRYLKWLDGKFNNECPSDQDITRVLVDIHDTLKQYPGTVMKSSGILGNMQVRALRTFLGDNVDVLDTLSAMLKGTQIKKTSSSIPPSVRSASANLESVDLDVVYGNVDEVSSTEEHDPVELLKQYKYIHPEQLPDLIRVLNENKVANDDHTSIPSQTERMQATDLDETPVIKLDRVNSIPAMYAQHTGDDLNSINKECRSNMSAFTEAERMGLLSGLSDRIATLRAEDEADIKEKQSEAK